MTTEDLKALLAQITPGPWSMEPTIHSDPNGDDYECDVEVSNAAGRNIHGHDLGYDDPVDLEIKANARAIALVPDLIAENIRMRGELERVERLEADERNVGPPACHELYAPSYWAEKYQRDDGPEACAESDIDCWEPADD